MSEAEVLDVLKSGILQSKTGKIIAGLFAQAMPDSIQPVGPLSSARLEEIADVVCHLAPEKWLSALGENDIFPSGLQKVDSVIGFIQSQLDRSRAERDERISNRELVSDGEWDTLKKLREQGEQYIGKDEVALHKARLALQPDDELDFRPSPEEAHARLDAFASRLIARRLEPDNPKRIRWTQRYEAQVKELRDQLKPDASSEKGGWLHGPSWLEGLRGRPNASPSQPQAEEVQEPTELLATLQAFERYSDFYLDVTTGDSGIPEGWFAKVLYICNALHSINALTLNSSHITTRPGPRPSGDAWKNGAADFFKSPLGPENEQPANEMDPAALLEQFATKVDALLDQVARTMLPWDSAEAYTVLELADPLRSAYSPTTVASPGYLAQLQVELSDLLGRVSGTLLTTGAAVLTKTGDLIEANPGKTAGLFALYMLLSDICTSWLLPEPEEELFDPLSGLFPGPDLEPDETDITEINIMEGLADLFLDVPELEIAVTDLVNKSEYPDRDDDPQLIENIQAVLRQPVPGNPNVTFQDCIDAVVERAAVDAHDEWEDESYNPAQAYLLAAESPETVRNRRSLNSDDSVSPNSKTSESGAAVRSSAQLLIQAGMQASDAKIRVKQNRKLAPGITVRHVADKFIGVLNEVRTVSSPALFMNTLIEKTISSSDLPQDIKSTISAKTKIVVEFNTPRPVASPGNYFPNNNRRYKEYTLVDLFAGQHERAKLPREVTTIFWPPRYTEGFKKAVADNDFPELFKENAERVVANPQVAQLWKSSKEMELKQAVDHYLRGSNATALGKNTADGFLKGQVKARAFSLVNGPLSGADPVSNAVYLFPTQGSTGLFVFLGVDSKVIECPPDLFVRGGRSIEEFPELSQALSRGITMKAFLGRGEDDFKYSQGAFKLNEPHWTDFFRFLFPAIIKSVKTIKLPYWPVIFEGFEAPDFDLFDDLYRRQTAKLLSDIDTLTSTETERNTDFLIELLSDTLGMLSICAGKPEGGALLKALSVLFGVGSSAAEYARGEMNDDPKHSAQHQANGLRGAVFELVAPFAGKLLGKGISYAQRKDIAATVLERLKALGHLPPEVVKHLPKFDLPKLVVNANKKLPKWIPPVFKGKEEINRVLKSRFKDDLVINKLNKLHKGHQYAQRLMDSTGTTYFLNEKAGYVRQGFLMRGDMRAPKEVFAEGFKLRTEITDVRQVNGMNGGFGGGKNALDPDGMGISTSGIYKQGNVGAHFYGDGRDGYTYLIDYRGNAGFSLYENHNFASAKPSKIGFKPLEINIGEDIPGSLIVGAYDKTGKFIPNVAALKRSKAYSNPDPFAVPLPFKWAVKSKEFNSTSSA
ncbi:hypothetical protein [Pseudomonas sp. SDO55104_S430]